ncbi:hypothetical protein [Delftia lacustris]|uniref:Replication region DNA-binding N-term n=1 Tax=Delftia lacustris TaxID=558537 RepID=A0A1H3FYW6_9BURK|nr:hypothetical protein [Delftia lacustris]SDX96166.1 hypothetical protein SAMN05421547_1023 [Delftia lacustris]
MSRPDELSKQQEEASQKNDESIIEAFKKLEAEVGPGRRLPTVETVASMSGVARNTVRNRDWALKRLKHIKEAYKAARVGKDIAAGAESQPTPAQLVTALQEQVDGLLRQNAMLYEEVLYLRKLVATKDLELDELRSSRELSGNVRYLR